MTRPVVLIVATLQLCLLVNGAVKAQQDFTKFGGAWSYQSFRHERIDVDGNSVKGEPDLAIPWAPRGILDLLVDAAEKKITGSLKFGPAVLDVEGIAGANDQVKQLWISATAVLKTTNAVASTYKIKGF
jgi:hypothetical protein